MLKSDKFVARQPELAQLTGYLDQAISGKGQVCFLTGEAGSGKTTLAAEFGAQAQVRDKDLVITMGMCDPQTGMETPYTPFREVLGVLTGADETKKGVVTDENASRLGEVLTVSLATLVEIGPDLINLFVPGSILIAKASMFAIKRVGWLDNLEKLVNRKNVKPELAAASGLNQDQIFEQYVNVMSALSKKVPLVLVLDDLQWADADSIALLFRLGRRLENSRILIIGTYRPNEVALGRDGERHPLEKVLTEFKRYRGAIQVDLDQATDDRGHEFIEALLDSEPNRLDDTFRRALFQHTDGHPLFTVELLRELQGRGVLVKDPQGRWVASAELDWGKLPARVEGVIEERLQCLADDLRDCLTVASVEGQEFTAEVVARARSQEVRQLVRQLSGELSKAHRLVESQGVGRIGAQRVSRYRFSHKLFQAYLYDNLDEVELCYLHEAVGLALEDLFPDQRASRELAPRLGQHFYSAGDLPRALKYYALAGDAALASYANREAENRYRKALSLAGSDSERAPLLFRLGQALDGQSRDEECIQVWREGIELHRTMGTESSEAVARLYARSARSAWEGGHTPESLRLCQEGLEVVAGTPDSPGLALLVHEAARAYLFNGLVDKARPLCQQALEMAQQLGIADVQADALATMGLLPDQHPESAIQALAEAVEIAESASLPSHAARAHTNLAALLANRTQDFQTAGDHYRRSAEIRRLMGSKAGELLALGGLAEISLLLGDLEETQATFPNLRQLLAEIIDPGPAVFHYRKIEAQLLRYQGDLPDATRRLRALQAEERQRGNLQNLIEVDSQLAEILLESYALQGEEEVTSWQEAEESLAEARMISESGIGEKEWLCCLLSMIRINQGRFEDARRLLDEARVATSRISAPINKGWLSLAEARLATAEENWMEALAAFEKTVGILTKLQMRWWRARVLQDWAGVYAVRGIPADSERAQALLREALSSFDEMGSTYYAELVKDKLQALEAKSYT